MNESLQKNKEKENDHSEKPALASESKEEDIKDNKEMESKSVQDQLQKFLESTSNYFMHNILMQILYFALYSILTLSKRCLVCDIDFPSHSGLIKPTICKNQLCMYGHQELEISFDIASYVKNSFEIIDLLITFCFVAVKKGKIHLFSPIEVHGDPPNQHENFKKNGNQIIVFIVINRN